MSCQLSAEEFGNLWCSMAVAVWGEAPARCTLGLWLEYLHFKPSGGASARGHTLLWQDILGNTCISGAMKAARGHVI